MAVTWPCEEMRSSQRLWGWGVPPCIVPFLCSQIHVETPRFYLIWWACSSPSFRIDVCIFHNFGDEECAETATDKRWSQERRRAPVKNHLMEVAIIAFKRSHLQRRPSQFQGEVHHYKLMLWDQLFTRSVTFNKNWIYQREIQSMHS